MRPRRDTMIRSGHALAALVISMVVLGLSGSAETHALVVGIGRYEASSLPQMPLPLQRRCMSPASLT
jgi:hypothetical protein